MANVILNPLINPVCGKLDKLVSAAPLLWYRRDD